MTLTDEDILREIRSRQLVENYKDLSIQVQPSSFDLRLDHNFVTFPRKPSDPVRIDSPEVPKECLQKVCNRTGIDLPPGEFVLAQTREWVNIPSNLVARVEGRSTMGRLGLAVHITAGYIDPGFSGRITLELSNVGPFTLRLVPGTRISQIVFSQMTGHVALPYGHHDRRSKYQGQNDPIPPRRDR